MGFDASFLSSSVRSVPLKDSQISAWIDTICAMKGAKRKVRYKRNSMGILEGKRENSILNMDFQSFHFNIQHMMKRVDKVGLRE